MTKDRMKTVTINGVPYRMRGDMKLPNWRKGAAGNDPFLKGYTNYLSGNGKPIPEKKAKSRMVTRQLYGAPCLVRGDMHLPHYWGSAGRTSCTGKSTAARLTPERMKYMQSRGAWRLP